MNLPAYSISEAPGWGYYFIGRRGEPKSFERVHVRNMPQYLAERGIRNLLVAVEPDHCARKLVAVLDECGVRQLVA